MGVSAIRCGRVMSSNGAARLRGVGIAKAVEAIKANSQRRAEDSQGQVGGSARQNAKALNERGILTPRGGRWHPASVQRVISRTRPCSRCDGGECGGAPSIESDRCSSKALARLGPHTAPYLVPRRSESRRQATEAAQALRMAASGYPQESYCDA